MRRLAIFLIVVVLLLVVVDRVACAVAQREIAHKIQNAEPVSRRPDVTVHGFPFLTQALRGRYTRVDAELTGLTVQNGLTVDTLQVELRGLQVKISDALSGSVARVPVSSATAVATVSYASLEAAVRASAPAKGTTVRFAEGQGGRLAIVGDYTGPQLKLQIQAQAKVSIKDGDLEVGLLPSSVAALPEPVRAQLTSLIGNGYKLPRLPFGFTATGVTVGPTGITVRAAATSVNLG